LVAKGFNCEVLAVIPGPKEPNNANSVMAAIAFDFRQFGLDTAGMSVVEHCRSADGLITTSKPFYHKPFLAAVHADAPARIKLTYWLGVGAYLMCGWCWYQATRTASGDNADGSENQYMMGYHAPTLQQKDTKFKGQSIKMDHPGIKLTEKEQVKRCKAAKNAPPARHSHMGAKGYSIIHALLSYVSYNNLWLVPIAHTLYYGVVKAFVSHLLRPLPSRASGAGIPNIISRQARKVIQQRGSHMLLTSDFGRPYKDVIKYMGSYRMEDWQHFVECFSVYLFAGDVLPANCKVIWQLIQDVSRHYCRPPSDEACSAAARAAVAQKMMAVAVAYETQGFPAKMLTFNLHQMICRLPVQEAERGPVAPCTDYWCERTIREVKEVVHGHVSKFPEKTYANAALLDFALAKQLALHPGLHAIHSKVRPSQSAPSAAQAGRPEIDAGDPVTRSQMLGTGAPLSRRAADLAELAELVAMHVEENMPRGWDVARAAEEALAALSSLQPRRAWRYKSADRQGQDLIRLESKSGGRQNCWVLVHWTTGDGAPEPYMCAVEQLLKVVHPTADDAEVLRLAICRVYETQPKEEGMFVAKADELSVGPRHSTLYPVDVSSMDSKLVVSFPDGYGRGRILGKQFYNVSKTY
jgi:hypothetical protein